MVCDQEQSASYCVADIMEKWTSGAHGAQSLVVSCPVRAGHCSRVRQAPSCCMALTCSTQGLVELQPPRTNKQAPSASCFRSHHAAQSPTSSCLLIFLFSLCHCPLPSCPPVQEIPAIESTTSQQPRNTVLRRKVHLKGQLNYLQKVFSFYCMFCGCL